KPPLVGCVVRNVIVLPGDEPGSGLKHPGDARGRAGHPVLPGDEPGSGLKPDMPSHGQAWRTVLPGDEPGTPIRPERPPHKVLARGGSLMGNVEDPVLLWAWTVRHIERLIEELHYHNVRTSTLAIQVAWKDGESTGGAVRLEVPTDRFDDLLDAARIAL